METRVSSFTSPSTHGAAAAPTLRVRNYFALTLLIVGKLLGIGGLVLGSSSRVLGGLLLGLDGIFIVAAVVLCVRTMSARTQEERGHKAILRQMMKEGTLKQYLRDLEEEQLNGTRPVHATLRLDVAEDRSDVPAQRALS